MAYTDIDKPTDYFNTVLYTANNGTLNVTGVGFQPDWVWIKGRSYTVHSNMYDVVRGVQKDLLSGSTNAETSSGELTSFDSDGFTVVDSATDRANYLTNTHVAWNWLAGGTASSNTDGSITSSVSANTTAGFSIVSFTGTGANATVGHGLGVAPACIITKSRANAEDWGFYHKSIGNTGALRLNLTSATSTDSVFYNNTSPTTTVFSIGSADATNDAANMIAYCFAEKKGYSKFGSYTGNGSTDGTFVYTGFKPAWVMYKNTSTTTDSWLIHDNKRGNQGAGANPQDLRLLANGTQTESDVDVDFLSNGFKMRGNGAHMNANGNVYIYMAFAENPFVTSTGIPTTAR